MSSCFSLAVSSTSFSAILTVFSYYDSSFLKRFPDSIVNGAIALVADLIVEGLKLPEL